MNDPYKIVKSFENLLKNLPPAVAERVYQKCEADREAFIAYAEAKVPSKDPKYWATRNCKKCYGLGTVGSRVELDGTRNVIACVCTSKNYSLWLSAIRAEYNKTKGTV